MARKERVADGGAREKLAAQEFEIVVSTRHCAGSYDTERRWCDSCRVYVKFLVGERVNYCVECGGSTTLYSEKDMAELLGGVTPVRPKGGRPKKPQSEVTGS